MLPGPRVLQRPRPWKSPEEALWAARGRGYYRALAFRRDGLRVFILDTVFYDVLGLKKKGTIRTVFLPGPDPAQAPRIFAESDRKKQLPPLWLGAMVQEGRWRRGLGWVGLGGGGLVAGFHHCY